MCPVVIDEHGAGVNLPRSGVRTKVPVGQSGREAGTLKAHDDAALKSEGEIYRRETGQVEIFNAPGPLHTERLVLLCGGSIEQKGAIYDNGEIQLLAGPSKLNARRGPIHENANGRQVRQSNPRPEVDDFAGEVQG